MKRRTLIIVSILGVIVVAGIVYAVATLNQQTKNLDNVGVVMQLVGKHYVLPENEQPALATITDSTRVESEFFTKAEDGDKVLIYQNAKKVFLYRPSIDKLIEVGPVSIASGTAE